MGGHGGVTPMTDYAALSAEATAAPWSIIGDKGIDAPDSFPGCVSHYHIANCTCPSPTPRAHRYQQEARGNAALIVALRNGIADGSLVPRSEVDALVAAADAYLDCSGECRPLGGNNVTCRDCVDGRTLRTALDNLNGGSQ
jgi:hypothetical protein